MNTLMRNMVLMCFSAFVLNTAILAYADAGYFADNKQKIKEYIASDTLHYYIKDYQGNVRIVVRQDGAVVESNEYYPYGGLFAATTSMQPYKYSSKELDRTHGLDLYDSEARWYDSLLGRTSTMDPLAEKYYSISPYAWCAANPIAYIDKTGKQPIFNTKGFLIGVTEDSKGLQGMPIVMKQSNFHNRMTTEEASKYNVGIDGLLNKDAKKRFNNSYKNLSKRPDWDGKLTLSEANEWYAKGGGKPLYIDIKSLDLSMFYSLGEQYVGKTYYFNLLTCGNPKDGLVYGHLGFERTPNDGVRALSDKYDFDMKKWSLSTSLRNIETIIGNFVAGKGIPFDIIFYGEQKLKSKPIWAS